MKVLIVKVSSLGDIIHTLPAVTDAARAKRSLRFDWVVEEAFTEIPGWHPAVDKIIPVSFRRWRRNIFKTWQSGEFKAFKKNLQEEHYDLVIDAQGLIKSGIISRLARGLTVGLSNHTIREPLATLFYNAVYTVPWQQHAVERVRDLFSRTFNYSIENKPCDYGIDIHRLIKQPVKKQQKLVFFHGTTWDSKKWPDTYWKVLSDIASSHGFHVQLLWGNEEERRRANSIAEGNGMVEVLDDLTLTEIATELVKARAVVAVDTGLAHLAAALNVPVVSIYGASDPGRTGTYGDYQYHLQSSFPCSPCLNKNCSYQGQEVLETYKDKSYTVAPPCYSDNPPAVVWEKISSLMEGAEGDGHEFFG